MDVEVPELRASAFVCLFVFAMACYNIHMHIHTYIYGLGREGLRQPDVYLVVWANTYV